MNVWIVGRCCIADAVFVGGHDSPSCEADLQALLHHLRTESVQFDEVVALLKWERCGVGKLRTAQKDGGVLGRGGDCTYGNAKCKMQDAK